LVEQEITVYHYTGTRNSSTLNVHHYIRMYME